MAVERPSKGGSLVALSCFSQKRCRTELMVVNVTVVFVVRANVRHCRFINSLK